MGSMELRHHHIENLSPLLALCEGNPLVNGEFASQRDRNMGVQLTGILGLASCCSLERNKSGWCNIRADCRFATSQWETFCNNLSLAGCKPGISPAIWNSCYLLKIFGMYSFNSQRPGGCLNIKMSSYQYRNPHVKDKTVLRPSYL